MHHPVLMTSPLRSCQSLPPGKGFIGTDRSELLTLQALLSSSLHWPELMGEGQHFTRRRCARWRQEQAAMCSCASHILGAKCAFLDIRDLHLFSLSSPADGSRLSGGRGPFEGQHHLGWWRPGRVRGWVSD